MNRWRELEEEGVVEEERVHRNHASVGGDRASEHSRCYRSVNSVLARLSCSSDTGVDALDRQSLPGNGRSGPVGRCDVGHDESDWPELPTRSISQSVKGRT